MFWAGLMFANVTIILGEELMGPHATPTPIPVVVASFFFFQNLKPNNC